MAFGRSAAPVPAGRASYGTVTKISLEVKGVSGPAPHARSPKEQHSQCMSLAVLQAARRPLLRGVPQPRYWRPALRAGNSTVAPPSRQDARKLQRIDKARAYVEGCGYESVVAEGIVTTLENTPGVNATVSMLKTMGTSGLKSLADTVEAEQTARAEKIAGKAQVPPCK